MSTEKAKKYKISYNNIYNDDCKNMIKLMIKQNIKVDLILTDPPYNISKENNFKTIGRSGIDFGEWDKEFDLTSWLKDIGKIISENGSIIIFNDWKNMGEIATKLEKEGFVIKDLIRWIKPAPMPRNTKRRYVTDFELAIWATKEKGKWTFNFEKTKDRPYMKPKYESSSPGINRIHPTEKPEKLLKEIIELHSNQGDIIFDPFSGSGAISYTAHITDRYYLGCELDKKYHEASIKRISKSYIRPAFNHLGNKYRMIEDLMRYFPKKNIDYFVDAFSGSGIVSLSYKSPKKVFLNDKEKELTKIQEFIFNTEKDLVIKDIERIIKKYDLPTTKKEYKKEYEKLREDFNKTKEVNLLLVLVLFGFNQQIRFNKDGDFNIPTGKFYWNSYHKNKLCNFIENSKNKKIAIRSKDFDIFIDEVIKEVQKNNTVFYFDPPYLLSNATYNTGWTETEEQKLIDKLQFLLDKKYKWFLSNVLESKTKTNKILSDFIEKNKDKIEVIELNSISYKNSNYQRKTSKEDDREILIKGFKDE